MTATARSGFDLAGRPGADQRWPIARAFFVAAFSYVFLANAWLGDDAYITFRVIWNFVHGYGLVFNPPERVQAFTHPLWMLVMTAAHAITREFFFTALAVSYGFALASVLTVARSAQTMGGAALAVLCLLSSKAFIDYTGSGLEYPLSYLLLASFYVRFLRIDEARISDATLRLLGILAGLAFVNRMDSVLLYAAPMAYLLWRTRRRPGERAAPLILGCAVPAAAWLVFATIYYGFPFPNTYYAKVATGIPSDLLWRQGFAYLLNSAGHDPITLGVVGMWTALALRSGTPARLSAASALLYVVYTISVGGDFMSGRFFAMPFLVGVIGLTVTILPALPFRAAAAALVVYNVLMPIVPLKTTGKYEAAWPWRSQNGIKDERGHYHPITNVLFFSPFRQLPDHVWMREGLSFRNGPEKVTVQGSIGFYGLQAGPDRHLIDRNALSDPLLARLPVSPRLYFEFYAGHYFRDIPDGYVESIAEGSNRLADPLLHAYYDRLSTVIRGPIFSRRRLEDIWYLNAGAGRRLHSRFEARRPVALSIRAENERFTTDVGERADNGAIRSVGRPGYLQLGPGIPMKAGTYRARWVGAVEGAGTPFGFVDAWADGQRLGKRDVGAADVISDRRQIGELEFTLTHAVRSLEYRLWVDGRNPVRLERVELATVATNPSTHNSLTPASR